jgi:hypothetical protein
LQAKIKEAEKSGVACIGELNLIQATIQETKVYSREANTVTLK